MLNLFSRIISAGLLVLLLFSTGVALAQNTEDGPSAEGGDTESEQTGSDAQPKGVLTQKPEIIKSVEAAYPQALFDQGITGSTVLRITIDEKGMVTEAVVHESSGQVALDTAAVDALKQFGFKPAEIDHKPAPVQILYRYEFTIEQVVEEKVVETDEGDAPRGSLSGQVFERGNRTPLPGVSIRLVGMKRDTSTDAEGRFRIDNVDAGEIIIQLDDADHFLVEDKEAIEANKETRVIYYLERSGRADDTVTVIGRRVRKEVVRRTLTIEEIRKIPGSNGDALKVIQNLPGVARVPFGGAGLIIRGSEPRDSATLIGRHWVPLIFHFGGLRSVFPSELIKSIDFFPGNFSAEYGRFSGGLVDVRLRRPKKDRIHGRVEADVFDAGFFLEGPITDHLTFAISARRSYIDALLLAVLPEDAPISFDIAPRYYDYQAVLDYKRGPHQIHFDFLGSDDRLSLLIAEPDEGDPAFAGSIETMTGFNRAYLSWKWRVSKDVSNDVSFSVNRTVAQINLGPNLRFINHAWLLSGREDLQIKMAPWAKFRAGVDFEGFVGDIDIELPQPPKEGGDRGQTLSTREIISVKRDYLFLNPAVWSELKLDFFDKRLTVIPGLRIDYDSYLEDLAFDPRLTVRYGVVKKRSILKAGVGLFSKRPDPDESDPDFGNAEVDMEHSIHVSGGFEQQLGERWRLDVTGFYKYLFNQIAEVPLEEAGSPLSENPGRRNLQNEGKGRVYGLELLIKHKLKKGFFGWLSYTLMRSERKDPGSENWRLFDIDQTHILTILGMYKINTRWEFGGRFRYVTGNPRTPFKGSVYSSDTDTFEPISGPTNSQRVAPFHQLDLRLDRNWIYDTWRLTAYFELRNAYNNPNVEGVDYNYDFSEERTINGLPIIPSLGIRGQF